MVCLRFSMKIHGCRVGRKKKMINFTRGRSAGHFLEEVLKDG